MTHAHKANPRFATITDAALDATEQHVARVERVVARLRALYGFSETEAVLFMQQQTLDPPQSLLETYHVG